MKGIIITFGKDLFCILDWLGGGVHSRNAFWFINLFINRVQKEESHKKVVQHTILYFQRIVYVKMP